MCIRDRIYLYLCVASSSKKNTRPKSYSISYPPPERFSKNLGANKIDGYLLHKVLYREDKDTFIVMTEDPEVIDGLFDV